MNRKNFESLAHRALDTVKGVAGKVAAGTAMTVAGIGSAMATVATPGSAIAGELASGKSEVMLVIAAAAVIIGLLVLWAYVKRAR